MSSVTWIASALCTPTFLVVPVINMYRVSDIQDELVSSFHNTKNCLVKKTQSTILDYDISQKYLAEMVHQGLEVVLPKPGLSGSPGTRQVEWSPSTSGPALPMAVVSTTVVSSVGVNTPHLNLAP